MRGTGAGASTVFVIITLLAMLVSPPVQVTAGTGNEAPPGPHYNLNIIGVPKDKTADMTGDNGRRIFVDLGSKDGDAVTTKIMLWQSFDGSFEVLDANGTDGTASFKLPAPGGYTIWARARGKPGGHADMRTCVDDPDSADPSDLICSLQGEVFVRETGHGKNSFKNVTAALTTIVLVAGSPAALACGATTVDLFDPCLSGWLWQYANNGLKLLQLRFYFN